VWRFEGQTENICLGDLHETGRGSHRVGHLSRDGRWWEAVYGISKIRDGKAGWDGLSL
jgi:hypothetical protein